MFMITSDCGVTTIRTSGLRLLIVDNKAVAAEQDGVVYLFPIWNTSWRITMAAARFTSTFKSSKYPDTGSAYVELKKAIVSGAARVLSDSEYSVLSLTLSVG